MTKTISNGINTFKATKKISEGYQVWNIPSLGEGIIPLFEPLEEFQVNAETLRYIKVKPMEAQLLALAASYGIKTRAQAKCILKSKHTGPLTMKKKEVSKMALPIFEKYTK